jgi:hypothetical protein
VKKGKGVRNVRNRFFASKRAAERGSFGFRRPDRVLAWRCAIIVVSLAQVAAGVAWWYCAGDPDLGRFGLAACLAVGALGLVGQGTNFLRTAAVGANALFALVFVPGLLGRVVIRFVVLVAPGSRPRDIYTGIDADLLAAGMVAGGAVSALGLWRLSARRGSGQADPVASADGGRDSGST